MNGASSNDDGRELIAQALDRLVRLKRELADERAKRTAPVAIGTVVSSIGSHPVPGRQCSGEWMLTPGRWLP